MRRDDRGLEEVCDTVFKTMNDMFWSNVLVSMTVGLVIGLIVRIMS